MPDFLSLISSIQFANSLKGSNRNNRQSRIHNEGSAPYNWTVPATAPAGVATIQVDRTFPAAAKYAPLDWIKIINNETDIPLTLTINYKDEYYIPAGTIHKISGQGLAIHYVQITNNHAADTTTVGDIIVSVRKMPYTLDELATEVG